MSSYEINLEIFSYVLNGPMTCICAIFGIFFNILTIFILRKRDSRPIRKDTRSDTIRTNNSFLIIEKDLYTTCENQESELLQIRPFLVVPEKKVQRRRKPRICLYFSWLIGCDTALLVGSLLNYAVPTTLNLYATMYATVVPFW